MFTASGKRELRMQRAVQSNRRALLSAPSPFPTAGAAAAGSREEQGGPCRFRPPRLGPSSPWRSSPQLCRPPSGWGRREHPPGRWIFTGRWVSLSQTGPVTAAGLEPPTSA